MDFESDFLGRDMGTDTDGDEEHTLAHRAAASGDTQSLIRAIKQDPSVIQQKDADGYTPLAHAVLGKHVQALKRLVKMGADVNVQDAQGRTCLAIAAYQGWSDGVVYLLRKGARQDIVDKSGRTPLHAATYDTDTRSLLALMKRLSQEEINVGDNERMTALHWAAFHNRAEHVRQLLLQGCQPLQVDIDGKTPLHWAAQNGSSSCCPVLAEQCTDLVTTIDNCGKTAVHLAAAAGHTAILQDLARIAPSTCQAWDKDDRTPLHWAAATGHTSCVRVLLNMGVTPNPLDVDGVTPLEYATNAGHKECLFLLRDRLEIKPGGNKRKQNGRKQSSGGFFKGLFSKKKEIDKKKEVVPKETKLPQVVRIKKEHMIGNSNVEVNEINKSTMVSRRDVSTPREGGSKRWTDAHKEKEGRDAGVSTPSTVKTLSSWNDNSSYLSGSTEARATHLSPLGGLRPPSISPRVSHSPGLSSIDSVPKRRQGELSPLRLDRMIKDRMEIPMPEPIPSLNQVHDGGQITPTPSTQLKFNMNGMSVLPNIHTDIFDVVTEHKTEQTNLERKHTEKKKKHKRKRREKDQTDTESLVASPFEHETNIYRPQDRGRERDTPKLVLSYDNEEFMDGEKNKNIELNENTDKEKQTAKEVIKALAGLEMDEISNLSTR